LSACIIYIYILYYWCLVWWIVFRGIKHLAKKTYVPTLVKIVRKMCQYIIKYQETIRLFLDPVENAALTALELACHEFLATQPEDGLPE